MSDVNAATESLGAEFRAEMQAMRAELVERVDGFEGRLVQLIREDGERTRRHVDSVMDRMQDSLKMIAEAVAHHTVVLGDHESRLTKIEKAR